MDRGSCGAAVMTDPRINLLATLIAIGSLIAAVVIWEAVTRMTPSAVIPDAFERFEAPD